MKQSTVVLIMLMVLGLQAQSPPFIGAGNNDGITVTSSSSYNGHAGDNTIDGSGMDAKLMEASRFLAQATMGYDLAEIERTAAIGMEAWIDNQLTEPYKLLTPQMEENWELIHQWSYDHYLRMYKEDNPGAPITDEVIERIEDEIFGPYAVNFHYAWWQNTIVNSDQLRQRLAYALSQILVVSTQSDLVDHAEAITGYYDIFLRHAFGNYRDILSEVTLHPSMGLYLSHYNNPREIPEENLHPDENYAREVMQLFTIGLHELNPDGTRRQDADGNDIPTYNNNDIKEMAKVFTGLGADGVMPNPWVDVPFFGMDWYLADKERPLVMYEEWHEKSSKTILGDLELPPNRPGMEDISATLDYLFEHPNVGPFVSRQLIQRLVKSNPSPGYIARVAAVFANNGSGVRGDLAAVAKSILLDQEARTCDELQHPDNGHLMEPLLRLTQIAKALPLACFRDTMIVVDGDTLDRGPCPETYYWLNSFDHSRYLRQAPLGAPSVFNFYLPDHQPVGDFAQLGLFGPEYKLHDTSTALNYINRVFVTTYWNFFGSSWANGVKPEIGYLTIDTDFLNEYLTDPEELYNYMDLVFARGGLTDREREGFRAFINDQPQWTTDWHKVRGILFQMLISPDFTVVK